VNALEQVLYKTRKTFREGCLFASIDYKDAPDVELMECSNCDIWLKETELVPDQDKNPICKQCLTYHGM